MNRRNFFKAMIGVAAVPAVIAALPEPELTFHPPEVTTEMGMFSKTKHGQTFMFCIADADIGEKCMVYMEPARYGRAYVKPITDPDNQPFLGICMQKVKKGEFVQILIQGPMI